ncbi:MAG: 4-hydroxythreonine-4-phosphate dehydrogenase PdxA [Spirochaetota bacterium]|nr:4-hydroxythreonine-4-phosphate dehydrogenase PdxA [Spirochaetota bacterium]
MLKSNYKKILISSGDPHGIGVEIILKGVNKDQYPEILVIGSKKVFDFYKDILKLNVSINYITNIDEIDSRFDTQSLNVIDLPYDKDIELGSISKCAGELSLRCIDTAIHLIKEGFSSTLVTAPVSKEAIIMSNSSFIGHTEYLAQAFNVNRVTMLLLSYIMKVALITTHIAINKVNQLINKESVLTTLQHCNDFLKKMGVTNGKIAVCGLNPHAGEGGNFGDEENRFIIPAIKKAKKSNINVFGPYPSDTLFCQVKNGDYDLYVAMYHDQGLIPFKLLSFGKGVNMTLGLPFSRISVDHGTAFNIAGKGIAKGGSMKETLNWAFKLRESLTISN